MRRKKDNGYSVRREIFPAFEILLTVLAFSLLFICLFSKPAHPATNEATLFFPLEYQDCEIKHNRIVLSAWFNCFRTDIKGKYRAINIPAKKGSPIKAIKRGTIYEITSSPINGMTLTLTNEDGTATDYCHLSKIAVRSGLIKAGEYIANVGRSGRTTGYHLRITMRDADGYPICFTRDFGMNFWLEQNDRPTIEVTGAEIQ